MDLFGDFFDIDGDGETSLGEELLAYNAFEECTDEDDDYYENDDDEDDDD